MKHQHKYDANGKQLCCTLEEKMNMKTDKDSGCCTTHKEPKHSDDDRHDHSSSNQTTFQMFLPAIISFALLLVAIGLDNYFTQSWFTGWVRIGWYVLAYIPVGFPVIKDAFESIKKGDIFSDETTM